MCPAFASRVKLDRQRQVLRPSLLENKPQQIQGVDMTTKQDIESEGGKCEKVVAGWWTCTDKDGKEWWCTSDGEGGNSCVLAPLSSPDFQASRRIKMSADLKGIHYLLGPRWSGLGLYRKKWVLRDSRSKRARTSANERADFDQRDCIGEIALISITDNGRTDLRAVLLGFPMRPECRKPLRI